SGGEREKVRKSCQRSAFFTIPSSPFLPMPTDHCANRRKILLRELKQRGLDAMLVTSEPNVTWLTGFRGVSTWLLISPKLTILISASRYTTQIENECPGLEMHIRDARTQMHDSLVKVLTKTKIG